jgi:hypothetical protein
LGESSLQVPNVIVGDAEARRMEGEVRAPLLRSVHRLEVVERSLADQLEKKVVAQFGRLEPLQM